MCGGCLCDVCAVCSMMCVCVYGVGVCCVGGVCDMYAVSSRICVCVCGVCMVWGGIVSTG